MKRLIMSILCLTSTAHALVTGPRDSGAGMNSLEMRYIHEGGKVEPNENETSFQDARIRIGELAYRRKLTMETFGKDHFLQLSGRVFSSDEERVAGQHFYAKNDGHDVSLAYGFNFVHEPSYYAGMYAKATPFINFNENKFSVPRVDYFNIGFRNGVQMGPAWSLLSHAQFGSGYGKSQNSYVSFDTYAAWKLPEMLKIPATLRAGPYVEMDVTRRYDPTYDAAFSAADRRDRVQSAKFGLAGFLDVALGSAWFGTLGYIQKLTGYDAPATNALSLGLGCSF